MFATPTRLAACLLATVAMPGVLAAQDLKYTESTKVETRVKVPGMKSDPEMSTTYIAKGRIRTDDAESSMITDFAGGSLTQLDHQSKSYWTMTFADMMAMSQAMMAQAQGQAQQARQQAQEAKREADKSGVKAEFDLKVDQLGNGPRIAGYATRHTFVTLISKFTSETTDPTTGEPAEASFVFAADVYSSPEFPAEQARLEAMKMAADNPEMQKQAEQMAASTKQLMAMPGMEGMAEGLARLSEELEKIEGEPLRTMTYVVTLGPGVEFDREAILDLADKPIPVFDMGAAAKAGMKEALKDAAGLGGLLGRRRNAPPAQQQAAMQQSILMRTTTTVESVSRDAIPDATFRAPPNYKEKKPDWMKSGGN
jgi:hypothetical protein